MTEALSGILVVLGSFFIMIAGVGVARMPDLLIRLHCSTKAGSLGSGLVLLGLAFFFGNIDTTVRVIATIVFIALTAPVGAHLIGRGAYLLGVKLWSGTFIDELRDKPR